MYYFCNIGNVPKCLCEDKRTRIHMITSTFLCVKHKMFIVNLWKVFLWFSILLHYCIIFYHLWRLSYGQKPDHLLSHLISSLSAPIGLHTNLLHVSEHLIFIAHISPSSLSWAPRDQTPFIPHLWIIVQCCKNKLRKVLVTWDFLVQLSWAPTELQQFCEACVKWSLRSRASQPYLKIWPVTYFHESY